MHFTTFEIVGTSLFALIFIIGIVGTKIYKKIKIAEDMKDDFKENVEAPTVLTQEESNMLLDDMAASIITDEDYADEESSSEDEDEYIQY